MNKLTSLEHLRSLAEAAKAFTGGLFSTLAENVVDAILEERETSVPITIPSTGWQKNTASNYPYFYTYSIPDVTEIDRVDVVIAAASLSAATDCGLCPTCESGQGTITFRAEKEPTEGISGEYRVLKGKENS